MKVLFSLTLSGLLLIPMTAVGWQVYERDHQDSGWLIQQAIDQYRGYGYNRGYSTGYRRDARDSYHGWGAYRGWGQAAIPYGGWGNYRGWGSYNGFYGIAPKLEWSMYSPTRRDAYAYYRHGYAYSGRKYGPFTGLSTFR